MLCRNFKIIILQVGEEYTLCVKLIITEINKKVNESDYPKVFKRNSTIVIPQQMYKDIPIGWIGNASVSVFHFPLPKNRKINFFCRSTPTTIKKITKKWLVRLSQPGAMKMKPVNPSLNVFILSWYFPSFVIQEAQLYLFLFYKIHHVCELREEGTNISIIKKLFRVETIRNITWLKGLFPWKNFLIVRIHYSERLKRDDHDGTFFKACSSKAVHCTNTKRHTAKPCHHRRLHMITFLYLFFAI